MRRCDTLSRRESSLHYPPNLAYPGNKVNHHLEIGTMKNNLPECSTVQYILSWRSENTQTEMKAVGGGGGACYLNPPINYFHRREWKEQRSCYGDMQLKDGFHIRHLLSTQDINRISTVHTGWYESDIYCPYRISIGYLLSIQDNINQTSTVHTG
jgi:hypothetical protein